MRPPLFVELCAGTAALSLRLAHPRARPPVSRMGAKTGYADVILRCMGLRPGQGAEHHLFCEPDPGVRLLLHAYRDRALATAAADIIRSWKDEAPRELWERLRAEGPARCPDGLTAREVAREWLLGAWSAHGKDRGSYGGPGRPGGSETEREGTARRGEVATGLPATIAEDAREVDPREVARWLFGSAASYDPSKPWSGFLHPEEGGRYGASRADVARRTAELPTLPATITEDARKVDPPRLPPGVVVYIDPPYQGTTGYAHAFPRAEWLPVVRRWQAAGALVVVSEAEPIAELVADGWHAVDISSERRGQKRTFSKQQAEWLTLSRPPAWRPSVQVGLFGP